MNKKIIALFVVLFVYSISFEAFAQKFYINLSIKIATRKSNCKSGIGFRCAAAKVTVSKQLTADAGDEDDEMSTSAEMTSTPDGDVCTFDIDISKVTSGFYATYLADGKFDIDEDTELPQELLDAFKYQGTFPVAMGSYPLVRNGNIITVKLPKKRG